MTDPSPTDQMARMITGYWTSQAIYVAVPLGIADLLVDVPRTADVCVIEGEELQAG